MFIFAPANTQKHMKRLLITLTISLIAFSSFAQTTKLAVKGVPIEGTAKEFAAKLVAKGCTIDDENKNVGYIGLFGTFMNRPNTPIIIYTGQGKDIMFVGVQLECESNWTPLEDLYWQTVNTYKVKYGQPDEHVETFVESSQPTDDFYKYLCLKTGTCNYFSKWIIGATQMIAISINYTNYQPNVSIVYTPAVDKLQQAVYEDI